MNQASRVLEWTAFFNPANPKHFYAYLHLMEHGFVPDEFVLEMRARNVRSPNNMSSFMESCICDYLIKLHLQSKSPEDRIAFPEWVWKKYGV
jgi:hypothetical protein